MRLADKAAKVASRADLAKFARELAADFAKNGKSWENGELGRYLEAVAGFATDLDGYYANRGEKAPAQPSWRTIAELLAAATMYE
jgi:hypothetical protein